MAQPHTALIRTDDDYVITLTTQELTYIVAVLGKVKNSPMPELYERLYQALPLNKQEQSALLGLKVVT